jgi:hypothetical protein
VYEDSFDSTAISKVRRLLELTLQVVRLIFTSQPEVISLGLCSQIIRCFIGSVEQNWIPISCEYQEFMNTIFFSEVR